MFVASRHRIFKAGGVGCPGLLLLLSCGSPSGHGQAPSVAGTVGSEVLQSTVDTRLAASTGETITLPAGGDLQAALNTAQLGDVIVLQAGAAYNGPFTLPNKSGSGWITVRSSPDSSLPAPRTRVV